MAEARSPQGDEGIVGMNLVIRIILDIGEAEKSQIFVARGENLTFSEDVVFVEGFFGGGIVARSDGFHHKKRNAE